ncbi:MAG: prolyl oligopeptidase family serine peptidase [Proteobacteria bacterium]|nr:prolyl oligopeptidase family serine peptidase [Pseudomonadota bacterium]
MMSFKMKRLARGLGALALVALLAACSERYPPPPDARIDPVVDVIQGIEFVDNYRWLEDQESAETRSWIDAQNAYAETIVGQGPVREHLRATLRDRLDEDNVGGTRKIGDFEYFTMRRQGEEVPVIYRRPAPADDDEAEEPTVDEEYEVFMDPVDLDPTYRTLIEMMGASPDQTLMLYSIRQGGADELEIRIRNLETGEDLPDYLPNALYGGVQFDEEGTGFYYTHRSRVDGPRVRHHTLGEDSSEDEEIWGEGYGPEVCASMNRVGGGRYRLYSAQHGWARSDHFIQTGDGAIRTIVEGVPAHFQVRFRGGQLFIRTDHEASNFRLVVADPDNPTPDAWSELIPESEDLLESYQFVGDKIVAIYLHEVENRVRVFEMDGTPVGEVSVPEQSTVSVRGAGDGKATLTVVGYLTPATEYEVDLETLEVEMTEPPEGSPEGFEVTKLWFTSTGGARAPVYVMHRAGIALDGSHPTILNGYGGFTSNIKPSFSTTRMAWLEMGGVYAVATLRGGTEFGEAWHQDGMLENKQHVFDDFIAAAEMLIDEGYTTPDHLGSNGGSNGGLLVAAAMTQRPDLFRAVLCTYPDLDMVRFYAFQETNNMPALLEYGDSRIPEHFDVIRQYSPYQAVRDGADYPAVMLATGDLDTRVPPLQARRMTARLQAATASGLPVILWYDARGGHAAGRGRPMTLRIEDTARELTFMAQQLGLEAPN